MVLLDDERISNIEVRENQEELVSLKGIHQDILVDESKSQIMNQSDFFCHARRSVAEMLKEAAGYLPPGYQILIKEAYRPLSQQKKSFEMVYQDYQKMYPMTIPKEGLSGPFMIAKIYEMAKDAIMVTEVGQQHMHMAVCLVGI